MIRQLALFLAALFSLAPALAQSPAAAPPPADVRVALDTGAGRILIAVHVAQAPATAANFLRYVDQKRLDGASFYRGVGSADYGFVQGGAQNDPKRILPPVKHEPTSQTGLTHDDGALSMARYAPGSATGDFFIVLGKMPGMDAHPEAAGDNQGFAVFAHVIEGMDVVKTILAAPKSPTAGEGVMKGQMLEQPVTILTARRLP
ncbi:MULTISPECIES: peptidylprolyl isomerase [Sphingobium]|uniref:peptidylprolyl isomerase n=1 Tax=Sphingobium fuliginis (strain ATCC 27551) TaxID=336203 RepID=A0ABQ1ET48_SPHSA|nr:MULTISPECIES: peptidylprolyl isomerase [Sphingobium]OAP31760.1 peptidylprolyl isomerase [Sphingobium sp. 20006FA]AJR24587.1 peptidylprolyl isomerase [Sphingobium sp. YBL2]KXU31973.1 peptidylprolyl isomerase [Sphingobium sp. AM]KYC31951.1 peptidylprolyl isomerase [Sphingobium sp. 22B]RYL99533.1 peptidylprolyl isomerase [Sphingobium fuliginis]